MIFRLLLASLILVSFSPFASAQTENEATQEIEELDPNAPDVEMLLERFDRVYEAETGKPAHIEAPPVPSLQESTRGGLYLYQESPYCYREGCAVWLDIDKATQTARLYVEGQLEGEFLVSTGTGNKTPNFDQHPNGRIYDRYTSTKFPGGNYKGLGNMPYAVFIRGGFAVHGTPEGNWPKLGTKASHGCIRMHPDNGKIFNQLVRHYGVQDTWITVR